MKELKYVSIVDPLDLCRFVNKNGITPVSITHRTITMDGDYKHSRYDLFYYEKEEKPKKYWFSGEQSGN